MSRELIQDLLAKRQTKLGQAKLLQNAANLERRGLSQTEQTQISELLLDVEQVQAQISQLRTEDADAWARESQGQRTRLPNLDGSPYNPAPVSRPTFGGGGSVADRLFGAKRDSDGFASFGEWLQTLDSGRFDQRMRASNTSGIDSAGGFLVPQVYQNMFLDAVIERSIIASRCRKFAMTSDVLHLNGFDGNDHSSTLFGGLAAAWEQELPTLSEQSPSTRRVSFHARKLMILTQASNELVSDAPAYENMLGEALIQSTAWQLDLALLQGDGAGKPLGCINAGSTIEQAAEASQTSATVWYSNLLKMFSRLHPASYNTAIWAVNPSVLPQLFQLDVHESATALGSALVGDYTYEPFRESDGTFSLFGRPCLVTEKLPVLGTVGDVVLVDPQQYALAMRQEVVIEKSSHAGFSTDSSYFRSKLRCDGQPLWSRVITPRAGSTLSWCVVLATR